MDIGSPHKRQNKLYYAGQIKLNAFQEGQCHKAYKYGITEVDRSSATINMNVIFLSTISVEMYSWVYLIRNVPQLFITIPASALGGLLTGKVLKPSQRRRSRGCKQSIMLAEVICMLKYACR